MQILVTGAAGFIGSNVVRRLMQTDHKIHGCDNFSFGDRANLPAGLYCHETSFQKLRNLDHYDIIIHLATSNIIYAINNPIETFKNNALDTIEFFSKFNGKIIYTSTSSVYGQADYFPTPEWADINVYNAYDTSKRIAELYLHKRGYFTTLRLSNVYGPFQMASNPYCGVLGKFINARVQKDSMNIINPITIFGSGEATRDYTYVDDTVEAIVRAALQFPAKNTEINIGTGEETSVMDLAKYLNYENHIYHSEERVIDKITRRCLDIKKAKKELRWTPKTNIQEGINKTIEWLLKLK